MTTEEGGKTRLGNVVSALDDRIKALAPNAVIGLWTFDGKEGRSEVSAGPLGDQVDGKPRSEALAAALDRQHAYIGRRGVVHHAAADLPERTGQLSMPGKRIRCW